MLRRTLGTVSALAVLALVAVVGVRVFGSDAPPPADLTTEATHSPENGPVTASDGDLVNTAAKGVTEASADSPKDLEREAAATADVAPRMRLRVVDMDDQPVVATVTVSPKTKEKVANEDAPPTSEWKTDADGWCTLPIAAEGSQKSVLLRVEADGRHRQATWQRRAELTVRLPWVGALRGRVVDDESGAAVGGAELQRNHGSCKGCEPDRTTTRSDGTFALDAVPREDCYFTILAPGYPKQGFSLKVPGKGEPVDNEFRLRRGVIVSGRCIDLHTKAPLAGVIVSSHNVELATTGSGGEFQALALPPEDPKAKLYLQSKVAGHCTCTFPLERAALTGLELPMPATTTLRGTVCTPAGAPVEGARVRIDIHESGTFDGMPDGSQVRARTEEQPEPSDARGQFVIPGVLPSGKGRLRAWHKDYDNQPDQRWGMTIELVPDMPAVQVVLLPKAPLGPTGTIVGTFTVQGAPSSAYLQWKNGERTGSDSVRSEGTFRVPNVPIGEVTLTILPENYQWGDAPMRDRFTWKQQVTVSEGEQTNVTAEVAVPMGQIQGTIRYDDGRPAEKQGVYLSKPRLHTNAQTDAEGRYTLEVPADLTTVTIAAGSAAEPKAREVMLGATGVDFVVPRPGKLRYRFRREDGRRDNLHGAARRDGETWFRQLEPWNAPDPEGYRAVTLPRGSYTVIAAAADAAPVVRRVQLEEETLVDLVLTEGTTVTVALAEGSEPLPERCAVMLYDQGLEAAANENAFHFGSSVTSRRLGDLTKDNPLRGIGPGRHRLAATHKDVVLDPDFVEVGSSPVTVTVRWRKKP